MSKIGVISRMIRSSSSRWVRRLDLAPDRARPRRRSRSKGRGSSGKLDCSRFMQPLVGLVERDCRAALAERTFGAVLAGALPAPLPSRGVLGVVGDDDVRPGAADRGQRLDRGGALVDPAVRRGGLEHRVLAADVVGGDRRAGRVLDAADHVEVRQRGLDHHHVGALLEVELGLAHGLVGVGAVHLVAAAVAELGRRLRGLAERPVEGGGVLGAVGDDRHRRVSPPRRAGRGSRPRGRPSCRSARPRRRPRRRARSPSSRAARASESLSTSPSADDAAVAVRGVLAQAHVGDHDDAPGAPPSTPGRPSGRRPRRRRPRSRPRPCWPGCRRGALPRRRARGDLGHLGDGLGDREPLHRPASTSIGSRTPSPAVMNSGCTRWSAVRSVSRTRSRRGSVRRSRRRRVAGKLTGLILGRPKPGGRVLSRNLSQTRNTVAPATKFGATRPRGAYAKRRRASRARTR